MPAIRRRWESFLGRDSSTSLLATRRSSRSKTSGLDVDAINENYGDTWIDLATFEDTAYGVVAKANSKSTVWYKPNSFQQNGFEVPQTWDQLEQIVQELQVERSVPWAVGAQGRDKLLDADRLVRADLHPDRGGDNYDKLFSGELPFNDATVKEALEIMLQQVNDENVLRGVDGALSLSFQDAITRVFGTNPQAEMHMLGGFTGGIAIGANPDLKPGETIDFFPFPTIKEEHGDPLVGSGDVAAAFVNNEDVAKLLEFLSTPEAGRTWVSTGAIVSPNKGVPDDAYPGELVQGRPTRSRTPSRSDSTAPISCPATGSGFRNAPSERHQEPEQRRSLLDDYQAEAEQAFS